MNLVAKEDEVTNVSVEDVAEEDTVNNIYQFNDQLKDGSNSDDIIPESYSESTSSEKNTFRSFIADLKDIIKNGFKNLIHKTPNMDTLVTIGVLSSLLYSVLSTIMIILGNNNYVE